MADFKFEIIKNYGTLSTNSQGWTKEVNVVSWNGRNPKLDIRDWDSDHQKMSKGLTFTREEARELKRLLNELEDL